MYCARACVRVRVCVWYKGPEPGRLSQVGSRWNRKVDKAWREI